MGLAVGTGPAGAVAQGQSVVVRYDPTDTTHGTVVALSPPHSGPNGAFGWVVVAGLTALTLWSWGSVFYRRGRRRQEQEFETDYRDDEWAGSTNSA